jgi:hypothetical protein
MIDMDRNTTVASTCGLNGLVQETVQWQVLVCWLIWIMILYCGFYEGDETRDLLSDSSYAAYTAWN